MAADFSAGLARLQQLFDFIGEDGLLLEVKVHLVRDAMEAYNTLAHLDASSDEDKHILLDLPTSECEELLKLQVGVNYGRSIFTFCKI